MARTTPLLVAGIIEVDATIPLTPFIAAASAMVDSIAEESGHNADLLQQIETWLAAHFYTVRDPRATQERAGSVAVSYQSAVDLGLSTSHYGQMAMVLDTSGLLRRESHGKVKAGVTWLGTSSDADP